MNFGNEVTQHRLGHLKVGDDTIFERPNGDDVRRGSAKHPLGFVAHGKDLIGAGLHRDH